MTTCSCGAERKAVDRESTVRRYADRFGFSAVAVDAEPEVQNPFDPTAIYDTVTDPNLRTSISGPSLEIERNEETFCPNYAEHQEAYDQFVAEVHVTGAAARTSPAADIESVVDVEMLQAKVETLRAEVDELSTAQLAELREELTAMRESLADRIEQPRGPPERRRGPGNSLALDRVERLHEETRRVLETHVERELATRREQSRTQSRPEDSWPGDADARTSSGDDGRDADARTSSGDDGRDADARTSSGDDGRDADARAPSGDDGRDADGTAARQNAHSDADTFEDEESVEPSSCPSCGQHEVRVTRQNAVRQFESELELRKLRLDVSTDISLFGEDGSLDPTADVNVDPSVAFERAEDTFCGNFAGDQEAYSELLEDVETVDRLATADGPGQHIEESIDVEMVRSKIEHLPAQVPHLSAAELAALRGELTAMQESLSARVAALQDDQQATLRKRFGGSDRLKRLQNLEAKTQQVLDDHIAAELDERQDTPRRETADEPTPDVDSDAPTAAPEERSAEEPREPPPCDTCGQQEVRVERQTTVRQFRSELEFRNLALSGSMTPGLFGDEGSLEPSLDVAPSVDGSATFERNKDTFCGNFAGNGSAFDQLMDDVTTTDRLADRYGPGAHVEDNVDVELLRSKVEHLRTQVRDLSVEELTAMEQELTAMQESLSERATELRNDQRWVKLRDKLGFSSRVRRLENLADQARMVVDNHITTELAERQRAANREAADNRRIDRDTTGGGDRTATPDDGQPADPPQREAAADTHSDNCQRCEAEMARVRRRGRFREFTNEIELRELELGATVDLFTGTPSPKASPEFERRPDRFCKNFAGDDRALEALEADVESVTDAAGRNEDGAFVEDAVDVEMVRSKLELLPESISDLPTETLDDLRESVAEMRDRLTERIEELETSQRRHLERVWETLNVSSRLRRLEELKTQAVEVIDERLDPELDRRRGPDDGGPSTEPGADGPRSESDVGGDGPVNESDVGGDGPVNESDVGPDPTASSGTRRTRGSERSGDDAEGAGSSGTVDGTEPDTDEEGDDYGTDGQDSDPGDPNLEAESESSDEPDDDRSPDDDPDRRERASADEPEEDEREDEAPDREVGPDQGDEPEADDDPDRGPML